MLVSMALNKKQKKQLTVANKKLSHLKQQLAGAKKQVDDPNEVTRLECEIAVVEQQIRKIQAG